MKNPFLNKKGEVSKTKVGTALISLAYVITTVGKMMIGDMSLIVGLQTLSVQIGALLAFFGIRDLPILNQFKK